MATNRLFTFNNGPSINGASQSGNLAISDNAIAGYKWWPGPDEDLGYVIAHDDTNPNMRTEGARSATVSTNSIGFWRTSVKSNEAFLTMVNDLFGQNFVNGTTATDWLLTNGYSTSWSLDIVTSGLIVYYDPSNSSSYPGTGTTLTDLSGNGINGVMSSTGVIQNKMMTYNGTSSQVSIADNALLEPGTGDWTIEAWVYYSVITGSTRTFISKTNNGGGSGDWSYGLRTLGNGATRFEVGDGTTSVNSPSYTVSLGQWYQVVGVWTNVASNSIELYINGVSQGSNSHSFTSVKNSTNPLYLGNYNGNEFQQSLNGKMGIFRMYNKALSSVEILQNFNANKYLYGL